MKQKRAFLPAIPKVFFTPCPQLCSSSRTYAHRYTDVTCLVTTGVGKVYSAGLDISTNSPSTHDWNKIAQDMATLQKLLARLLTFPMPTVAAMNGIYMYIYYMQLPGYGIRVCWSTSPSQAMHLVEVDCWHWPMTTGSCTLTEDGSAYQ